MVCEIARAGGRRRLGRPSCSAAHGKHKPPCRPQDRQAVDSVLLPAHRAGRWHRAPSLDSDSGARIMLDVAFKARRDQ
jgi:hypothetical protein